jgi:hypothetical protein
MDNHGLVESQAVQQRQSSFIGRVGSLVADFFMPAAYADDGQEQNSSQDTSILSQHIPRERFSLLSTLPANSDNKFLNYSYAVGRGIEHARDATADLIVHPIDNTKELATMSWDGYNSISGILFGYSNANSRARNIERGGAILDSVDQFKQADGAKKLEVGTGVVAGAILGKVVTSVGGKALRYGVQQGKNKYILRGFDNKVDVTHAFPKPKLNKTTGTLERKFGHIEDTPEHRKILVQTFADERNYMYTDPHGKRYYAKWMADGHPDGQEAWAYTKANSKEIQSVGVNKELRYFNKDGTRQYKYIAKEISDVFSLANDILISTDVAAKSCGYLESTSNKPDL